jgi:hypothetical protein
MRCYQNYKPQQFTPIGRVTSRCVYDGGVISYDALGVFELANKLRVLKQKNPNTFRTTKTVRYAYLIQFPPKVYATQGETYTNPNTLGFPRVGTRVISVNNNPTCPNMYPIDNPLAFPSNQPSPIYPVMPPIPVPTPQCINYTALAGGVLIQQKCITI